MSAVWFDKFVVWFDHLHDNGHHMTDLLFVWGEGESVVIYFVLKDLLDWRADWDLLAVQNAISLLIFLYHPLCIQMLI